MAKFTGTSGDDNLTGTSGNDKFSLSQGGNDTANGGDGNDQFILNAALTAEDRIDGGTGTDTVTLKGDYGAGLVFDADTIRNVEKLHLLAGFDYTLTMADGNVAGGEKLAINATALKVGDVLTFDGRVETDGAFTVQAGQGDDVIWGGALRDIFTLSKGGSDTVAGGGGNDLFNMKGGFNAGDKLDGGDGADTLSLDGAYSGVNAVVMNGDTIKNIETILLAEGRSYTLTTADGNVAAGQTLTIDAGAVTANPFVFNGAMESDGSFVIIGGGGNDTLSGGNAGNVFDLTHGGRDMASGGQGVNVFNLGATLDTTDRINGALGASNTMVLNGAYFGLTVTNTMIANIQTLDIQGINTTSLIWKQSGALTVDASTAGGSLTFDYSGVAGTSLHYIGGGALNTLITGSNTADVFDGGTGVDAFNGGNGDDSFSFAGGLTASDRIDGAAGSDTLVLNGDYAAGVTFNATTVLGVETLRVAAGHDYNITTDDATVGAGQTLTVDASALTAARHLTFNGAAEQSGSFAITGGAGVDNLTGGKGADGFNLSTGGNDVANGGDGNDTFTMGAAFTANDSIAGGIGADTLSLNGDYAAGVTFLTGTMSGIETLLLAAGHSYNLTPHDGNVANGLSLTVDGSAMGAGDVLTFNGFKETDGSFVVLAGAGSDVLTGGAKSDTFTLTSGGNDTVHAGDGNDGILMGASLTTDDAIDGGAGSDTVTLSGNYSAGVVFGASTITNVETLLLTAGNSYNFTAGNGTVGLAQSLTVDASALGAGNALTFNGAAEADGSFLVLGGAGADNLTGGAQGDTFNIATGGNDTVHGGDGSDTILAFGALTSGDAIDGGAAGDTLNLNGDYSAGIAFGASTIANVETLQFTAGHSYNVTTHNGNVANGLTLTVDGSALGAGDVLTFSGAAEADGFLSIIGGAGSDALTGGAKADSFTLTAGGNDTVHGGAGNDTILMGGALTADDRIDGGDDADTLNLNGDYAGLTLDSQTFSAVETLQFAAGHNYNLTGAEGNVGSGQTLAVDASALGAANGLTFNGAAESDGFFAFLGGAGNDVLTGGAKADTFNLSAGGSDTVHGGDGDDTILMGASLNTPDRIDGGAGTDKIVLDGDYSAGITLVGLTISAIETLQFAAGHSYNLTTNNTNLGNGLTLTVDGSALGAGDVLTFNGAAEADGFFAVAGGAGNDVLTGGAKADTFNLSTGGADTVSGGDGNDTITLGAAFTAADAIDGGTGSDVVTLSGNYAAGIIFGASTIANIETLSLGAGFSYRFTANEGNLASGQTLTVDASALAAANTLNFNGAAESQGTFTLTGGAGNDVLTGGAQADVFNLGLGGSDNAGGGAGDDTFNMGGAFTLNDKIDGGDGFDTVMLDTNTTLVFGAATMVNVEKLLLTGPRAYTLTMNDANVAAGETLIVDGSSVVSSGMTFRGNAETDGFFSITGGSGFDTFNLGAVMGGSQVSGGAGTDKLILDGDYSAGLTFTATSVLGIEQLQLTAGHGYNITTNNATVGAGQSLTVIAGSLGAADALIFDGSAETDGSFTISAGAGDDVLTLGAGFTASSQINAGAGDDIVSIAAASNVTLTLNGPALVGVETVNLGGTHNYNFTTVDAGLASGQTLTFDASALGGGGTFTFNGSAEQDGHFVLAGGAGNDSLTGGMQSDTFNLGAGGNDTVSAGLGDDVINAGAALTASDTIDGGTGTDTLSLDGDYSAGLTFGASTMTNVETLLLAAGHSYTLTTDNANVTAVGLTVDAGALGAADVLTFNGAAENTNTFRIIGGAGDDVLTGGTQADFFDLTTGGNDTVHGGGGDTYHIGAAFTADDAITGGGGDSLSLQGDYSAGVVFAATTMTGVSQIQLQNGEDVDYDYDFTLAEATIATGQRLTVGGFIGMGKLTLDLTADTDGLLTVNGGGGAGDTVKFGSGFNVNDDISLGAGDDTVSLDGDYSSLVEFKSSTISGVDTLLLAAGHSYNLQTNSNNVAAAATLTVDGSALGASDVLTFDGAFETNGHFAIAGGAGADVLIGGAISDSFDLSHGGADTVTGKGGADGIVALAGADDVFVYAAVSDSTSTAYDTVTNADFDNHVFNVSTIGAVTGVDAPVAAGALSSGSFDADLTSAVGAGQLLGHHAVLFTADSGDLAGHTFLVIDENGAAGYQSGADLVIEIVNSTGTLSMSDFG